MNALIYGVSCQRNLKDFKVASGNSVFFNGVSFFTHPEAIRYLARKYNIEIEETELPDAEKQIQIFESMYLVSELPKTIFIKRFKIRGR
jgi:DNA primase